MAKPKSARKQPLTDSQKAGLGSKGPIVKFQRAIKNAIDRAPGGRRA